MANQPATSSRLDLVMQSRSSFHLQEIPSSLRIRLLIHRLETGTLPKYEPKAVWPGKPTAGTINEVARKRKLGVGKE
jgi:hypothetical protein